MVWLGREPTVTPIRGPLQSDDRHAGPKDCGAGGKLA